MVIKLQVHPIMDFIVPQRHVVLKNRVPLLQYDLVPTGASLGCDQLLKVPDGVIRIAFNADLLPQTVVANNLDHPVWSKKRLEPADATTSSLEGRAWDRVDAKNRKRKCSAGSPGPGSSQCLSTLRRDRRLLGGKSVPRSGFVVPSLGRRTPADGARGQVKVAARAEKEHGESEVMDWRPADWMPLVESPSLCRNAVRCDICWGGQGLLRDVLGRGDDLLFLNPMKPLTAASGLRGA